MEGVDRFKIAFKGDLHFGKQLPRGGIDFWRPPLRLWRGRRWAMQGICWTSPRPSPPPRPTCPRRLPRSLPLCEEGIKLNLSGNEVYYTACSLPVIVENSCSKLHYETVFNSNPSSYKPLQRPSQPPRPTCPRRLPRSLDPGDSIADCPTVLLTVCLSC